MKILKIALCVALLPMLLLLASCGKSAPDAEKPGETEKADETEVEETVKLTPSEIKVDGQALALEKGVTEYEYRIPDGDPYIPSVEAKAEDGCRVRVIQGFIPYGENEGFAQIILTKDAEEETYKVKFVKDAEKGFVLQYGDVYKFDGGEGATYVSSAPTDVTVDADGKVTAKKLTDSDVTVTAKTASGEKTLVINGVKKARVNLVFITGQSIAQGCYDTSDKTGKRIPTEDQHELIEKVEVEGMVYGYDLFPRSEDAKVASQKGRIYDMYTYPKQGFETAIGNAILYGTGEKTLFYQTAYSGAPIESWLDSKRHEEAGTYAGGHNFYDEQLNTYNKALKKMLANNYEVIRVSNVWIQGTTAMSAVYSKAKGDYIFSSDPAYDSSKRITDETYYEYYMKFHNDMVEDFGLEYDFMVLDRASHGVCSEENRKLGTQTDIVPIRASQYTLTNENKDIIMITRITDQFRPYSSTDKDSWGYGFIGVDNAHFNQIGYNALGQDIGKNMVEYLYSNVKAESVEIINSNGKTRIGEGDTVSVKKNASKRLAAMALPMTSNELLTWESSDENTATVDRFGTVKGVGNGTCKITAKTAGGIEYSITVSVTG